MHRHRSGPPIAVRHNRLHPQHPANHPNPRSRSRDPDARPAPSAPTPTPPRQPDPRHPHRVAQLRRWSAPPTPRAAHRLAKTATRPTPHGWRHAPTATTASPAAGSHTTTSHRQCRWTPTTPATTPLPTIPAPESSGAAPPATTAQPRPDASPTSAPTTPADPPHRPTPPTTAPAPAGANRTRTRDAPAACNDTPCQENGKHVESCCVGNAHRMQRRVQDRRMNPEPTRRHPACSGTATSAKTSVPRRHIACMPRNAGP